jgi:hypothetical protein
MIRRLGRALVPALLSATAAAAQAPTPVPRAPSAVERAAATITPEDLQRRIGIIAHDSMRGRFTPSPELEKTAEWIAGEFRRLGMRPGGDDGGYVQRYGIRRVALDPGRSGARFGRRDLRYGRDFGPAMPIIPPRTSMTGPLMVVSGSQDADRVLGATSFTGKHVLIIPPLGLDTRDPEVRSVLREVLARDPLGIWVPIEEENRDWVARVNAELRREHLHVGEPTTMPVFVVRDIAIAQTLKAVDLDLVELRARADAELEVHEAPDQLISVTTEWHFISDRSAPNVVGIVEGSDPVLKNEYVVFSAHMDHVGVGEPNVWGDSIYNGADDDASGTSTIVELAEAYASLEPRPRRSIMVVGVSGEEHGLWGSDHFVENPPVPLDRMVADLNVDMVGRNWADTIVAIGKEHSDLGATLAGVSAAHREIGMTVIDDPWPYESFYTRSDHYNFARKGVPVLFFFSGTHEDYHEPSDQVEKIDTEKTARIGRLLFHLGLEIADRDERPKWYPQSYRAIVSP